eukprot:TRINITY_DN6825_c0_g1_i2.p1 TRINITY_DN6825_c0_g1~~TRINITY_DN6825_c0_g1_i2.p1  ORF type:complete len:170 (-),score=7.67 TRINITY_DN6825_c0_g1_i2:177-686(-)
MDTARAKHFMDFTNRITDTLSFETIGQVPPVIEVRLPTQPRYHPRSYFRSFEALCLIVRRHESPSHLNVEGLQTSSPFIFYFKQNILKQTWIKLRKHQLKAHVFATSKIIKNRKTYGPNFLLSQVTELSHTNKPKREKEAFFLHRKTRISVWVLKTQKHHTNWEKEKDI